MLINSPLSVRDEYEAQSVTRRQCLVPPLRNGDRRQFESHLSVDRNWGLKMYVLYNWDISS